MDEDIDVDPDDPVTTYWERDASTSRTVRLLWSLSVGTFIAMATLIVGWRLYDLADQAGVEQVAIAATAAFVITLAIIAVDPRADRRLAALAERLSITISSDRTLERAVDAITGTLVMGLFIGLLMGLGRLASQDIAFESIGPGPFTGLAAATLPVALIALALSSFLRSKGALDPEDGVLYLLEPDVAIDLRLIVDVSSRQIGDAVVVTLSYARPDNQYVAGPRRIVVSPAVADELERTVAASR